VRDSLAAKLIRLLERELAHVTRHDPYVADETESLESALAGANAVVVATNHSEYESILPLLPHDAVIVDPWNVTGTGEVFAAVRELARNR
jgi:UDP-N-acetyl-D-mannosaminuronic acid dehydrogenase